LANVIEILVTGRNLTKPAFDEAARNGRAIGQQVGGEFSKGVGDKVKQELPPAVEAPLEESGGKGGTKAGQAAAKGLSPLLIGAFAAAATAGPGLLIAGTATAVLGAGALITKGNAQLASSYQHLGQDAADAVTAATAPLVPALAGAVKVLDDGVAKGGAELRDTFAAAAPYAREIASGIVSLGTNALPGVVSLLRAGAPYAHDIAVDFGKIGSAVGGLFQGLGSGAAGGMAGLNAVSDVLKELLPDVGRIVGALSGGLGPALHDVADVALPVAHALTAVVGAIPPGAVEAAAVATAALFAAFKVGALTGIVQEGTTFLAFLGTTVTAEGAAALATDALAASAKGLGAAVDIATGPIGWLAAATTGLYVAIKNTGGGFMNDAIAKMHMYTDQEKALAADAKGTADAVSHQADVSDTLTVALNTAASAAATSAQQSAVGTLAALGFTKGISSVTDSLYNSLTAYTEAGAAASAYGTVLDATFGKFGNYSAAEAAFTTGLANASKELTHGKDAIDLNTTAGAANFTVLKSLSDLNETRAEKLLAETNSQQQANKSLQAGAVAIDTMAKKAGFTKDQIDALNVALYGTKNIGSIEVPIHANTSGLIGSVKAAIGWIEGQTVTIPVGYGGPAHAGLAHGGIVGSVGMAAAGGPRSNLTLVGEHGIELLDLAPGTRVHSNPDTQRMLQGGGGGTVRVELEWVGGGADPLFELIREHVRARAGNSPNSVQLAFGQTY